MPFLFSNPQSQLDTYVSWRGAGKGHLRKIQYGLSPPTFNPGSVIDIPKGPNDTGNVNRFNFGFGTLPGACSSGQEGVFVVWTNGGNPPPAAPAGRCGRDGTREDMTSGTVYWNLAIYDTGNGSWYPSTGAWNERTDSNFSACVGTPLNAAYTNTADPHIAVDPTTSDFWITHTRQKTAAGPVRTIVRHAHLVCVGGNPNPSFDEDIDTPDPGSCANCDNWNPAIAMHRSGGIPRVMWYWYSATDAAGDAGLFMSYQENLGPAQGPINIMSSSFPVTNGATTWSPSTTSLDPWDYQTLGTSWYNASFLSVWGADLRNNSGTGVLVPGWNGGFETGSFTANGLPNTDWVGSGAAFGVSSSAQHSGSYSALLGLTTPTNGDSSITQTFVAPKNTNRVSFFYKMTCPEPWCGINCDYAIATLTDNTTSTTVTILPKTCTTSAGWLQVQSAIIAGDNYTITLTSHDDNYAGDASYTYFDDVVFTGNGATMMTNVTN